MKILGNIIWVLFGGFFIALEYFVSSIGLFITIIGIPFGIQTLKLGVLALWPFGSQVVDIPQSSGCLSFLMNVIWFFSMDIPIPSPFRGNLLHHHHRYPLRDATFQTGPPSHHPLRSRRSIKKRAPSLRPARLIKSSKQSSKAKLKIQ
jgi:hypothetical protein